MAITATVRDIADGTIVSSGGMSDVFVRRTMAPGEQVDVVPTPYPGWYISAVTFMGIGAYYHSSWLIFPKGVPNNG
ncbi:MAG: hypothetical protein Q8M94_01540 [Ignavibacteria bacterium]|nr:hypothetical protein [Ignavibacteria bacterium]